MSDPTPEPERPEVTQRGFMAFDRITLASGDQVGVRESSSAEGCKLWLDATQDDHDVILHLDEDSALLLVRRIVYLLDHHHNVPAAPVPPIPPSDTDAIEALPEVWRKRARNKRPRGIKELVLSQCAGELERALAASSTGGEQE